MPHMQKALEALFRNFEAYCSHLENASNENAKAEGLAKMMIALNVIIFAFLVQVRFTQFPNS